MDCSTPGWSVLNYLLESVQTHVHWVSDATISSSVLHYLLESAQTHVQWVSDATISPSLSPFSSCLQSFPASGSFPGSWLFTSGGQSIGASASASVFPMNIPDWFPLGLTGWISLQSRGLSSVFCSVPQFESIIFSALSLLYGTLTSIRDYWKNHSLTIHTFVGKLKYLLFNSCLGLSLEKAIAPHSSTLAWKIPRAEEPDRLQFMGSLRVWHDWATSLSLFTFMHWRRKWQPTPVFLPGESQGWGSLVGCHLWGRIESDTTEAT